jgi:hypothetical protein
MSAIVRWHGYRAHVFEEMNSMKQRMPRRRFLARSLAAGAVSTLGGLPTGGSAAAAIAPKSGAEKLTTYQFGPQIWLRWADEPVVSYRAHPTQKYPYFYPVSGPVSGLSLTTESGSSYPHHRSLLFACDHLNGGNYWQGEVDAGQIVSDGLKLGACTSESAEIIDQCQWHKPGESAVMRDERSFKVTVAGPRLRTIDARITWTAVADVTILKTNHSLFALRAAQDITPWGGGTLVNSNGQEGEKATFGQEAQWCAYYGKRKGNPELVEGIALLDHPQNPWSRCKWFTRDYGFISATPFNFIEKPWQLEAGQSVSLRYRVVLFAGDPKEARLAEIYRDWAV